MIIAQGLKKSYKTKIKKGFLKNYDKIIHAVKGIDINIEDGRIVGLLGVNGAGKTTTIKMMTTLLQPDEGECKVDGFDVIKDGEEVRKIINVISGSERMLYWRLTGRENLKYFGSLYNLKGKGLTDRIEYLSNLVGLGERIDEPVERYSKGMKQRLQIARGLINNPKYIFLDEPTLGLDIAIAKDIREYTKRIARQEGKGILLTSHYIKEIEDLCDYVYVINDGITIKQGTPKEISKSIPNVANNYIIEVENLQKDFLINLDNFKELHSCEITSSSDMLGGIKQIQIATTRDLQQQILEFFSTNSRIIKFNIVEPNLEDAIISLTEVKKNEVYA